MNRPISKKKFFSCSVWECRHIWAEKWQPSVETASLWD